MNKACVLRFAFVFILGLAGLASADLTPIKPAPVSEVDVKIILDTLYGAGNYERVDDSGDQIWQNLNGGAEVEAKYAGYTQVFGYIPGTSGNLDGFVALFTVTGNGYSPTVTPNVPNVPPAPYQDGNVFRIPGHEIMAVFRWGNDPNDQAEPNLWSSSQSDNPDENKDHMVSWKITGTDQDHPDNAIGNYVLACEDLYNLGDQDYNDLVVEVSGAAPVPEASTLLLFGSGCSGLLFLARKKGLVKF